MALKKIEIPEIDVRMWVADVPLSLKNELETKRRKMRINKRVCMVLMMESFLANERDPIAAPKNDRG